MRVFASTLVGAVVLTAAAANAADLPVRAATPALPVPAYSWTGCYIGAAAGGGVQHDFYTAAYGLGAVLGGQLGCNYQTGLMVLGVEGEGFWSSMQDTYNSQSTYYGASNGYSTKNTWEADVAARIGLAFDRVLLFSKAGVAWGGFNFGFQDTYGSHNSGSSTLIGMIIGVGAEYAFAQNWSAKVEVDYLGFYSPSQVSMNYVFQGTPEPYSETQSAQQVLFKLGVNRKF